MANVYDIHKKTVNVIKSCKNKEQYKVAVKYSQLAIKQIEEISPLREYGDAAELLIGSIVQTIEDLWDNLSSPTN